MNYTTKPAENFILKKWYLKHKFKVEIEGPFGHYFNLYDLEKEQSKKEITGFYSIKWDEAHTVYWFLDDDSLEPETEEYTIKYDGTMNLDLIFKKIKIKEQEYTDIMAQIKEVINMSEKELKQYIAEHIEEIDFND